MATCALAVQIILRRGAATANRIATPLLAISIIAIVVRRSSGECYSGKSLREDTRASPRSVPFRRL